jgi:hypothetical protein
MMRFDDVVSSAENIRDRIRQVFDGFAKRVSPDASVRAAIQNEIDDLLVALDDESHRMIEVLRSGGSLIENQSDAPAADDEGNLCVLSSDEARAAILETFARGMKPKN